MKGCDDDWKLWAEKLKELDSLVPYPTQTGLSARPDANKSHIVGQRTNQVALLKVYLFDMDSIMQFFLCQFMTLYL